MYPFLVADIGGTNARFGIVTGGRQFRDADGIIGTQYTFARRQTFKVASYPSLEHVLYDYLKTIAPALRPRGGCAALACPIVGRRVKLTNASWEISADAIRQHFEFDHFELINDFAALALSCGQLRAQDVQSIKTGTGRPLANRMVLGPGTGLGIAGILHQQSRWVPIAGEGGHANLAPVTKLELEVIRSAILEVGHVSAEYFLSGPGLVNLHRNLARVKGLSLPNPDKPLLPEQITKAAIEKRDTLCRDTLSLFCSLLGAVAGNCALIYGAVGGVYLAGGILPHFMSFLKQSDFVERFSNKGIMSPYLHNVPVHWVSHQSPAFLGAAVQYQQVAEGLR